MAINTNFEKLLTSEYIKESLKESLDILLKNNFIDMENSINSIRCEKTVYPTTFNDAVLQWYVPPPKYMDWDIESKYPNNHHHDKIKRFNLATDNLDIVSIKYNTVFNRMGKKFEIEIFSSFDNLVTMSNNFITGNFNGKKETIINDNSKLFSNLYNKLIVQIEDFTKMNIDEISSGEFSYY